MASRRAWELPFPPAGGRISRNAEMELATDRPPPLSTGSPPVPALLHPCDSYVLACVVCLWRPAALGNYRFRQQEGVSRITLKWSRRWIGHCRSAQAHPRCPRSCTHVIHMYRHVYHIWASKTKKPCTSVVSGVDGAWRATRAAVEAPVRRARRFFFRDAG